MHPGSEAISGLLKNAKHPNEEALQDGHFSQSEFKRLPVESFSAIMRKLWHIKGTADDYIDVISSYHVVYQQVRLGRSVSQIRFIYSLV